MLPYGTAVDLLARLLLNHGCNIGYCRKLGRFTVSIPKNLFRSLASKDYIEKLVIPAFPCWIIHFMTTVMVSFHQTNP